MHPGGVDDRPRPDRDDPSIDLVAQDGPVGGDALGRTAGDDRGPLTRRGTGDPDDQTGVVDQLAVEGQDPGEQALPPHSGKQAQGLARAEHSRAAQDGGGGPRQHAEEVAGPHAGTDDQGAHGRVVPVHGDHHRQGPDEVGRGDTHEDVAFTGALVGDTDLSLGEVAQPAVDQFGAPPTGAEGEVVAFDENGAQTTRGGVQRHPGPRDPAPDHQHVDVGSSFQCGEFGLAAGRVQGGGPAHGASFQGRR